MNWKLLYHPDVYKDDLPKIPLTMKNRIRRAIEERLLNEPVKYGTPLRRSLKGYFKMRVGDYRIIYKIAQLNILVLKIGHRKEVYKKF